MCVSREDTFSKRHMINMNASCSDLKSNRIARRAWKKIMQLLPRCFYLQFHGQCTLPASVSGRYTFICMIASKSPLQQWSLNMMNMQYMFLRFNGFQIVSWQTALTAFALKAQFRRLETLTWCSSAWHIKRRLYLDCALVLWNPNMIFWVFLNGNFIVLSEQHCVEKQLYGS